MTSATNASPTVGERHLASDGWIGPKDTPGTASASEPFSGWVKQVRVAADGAWVHSRVITRPGTPRRPRITWDGCGSRPRCTSRRLSRRHPPQRRRPADRPGAAGRWPGRDPGVGRGRTAGRRQSARYRPVLPIPGSEPVDLDRSRRRTGRARRHPHCGRGAGGPPGGVTVPARYRSIVRAASGATSHTTGNDRHPHLSSSRPLFERTGPDRYAIIGSPPRVR